jgi:hypothetical protein
MNRLYKPTLTVLLLLVAGCIGPNTPEHRTLSLYGRIVDQHGQPVPNVKVSYIVSYLSLGDHIFNARPKPAPMEPSRSGAADLIQKDLAASNGVIHGIDTVQIPAEDIIEVARSAGSFKMLLAALDTAQLTSVLRAEGPFTVFAPTDEAFAKLPKGTAEALLKDKAKLSSILTYHVRRNLSASRELLTACSRPS